MRILKTFFSEFTTQSKTAFSFGTRLMVLSGRSTRSTRSDLMVLKFWPVELPLNRRNSQHNNSIRRRAKQNTVGQKKDLMVLERDRRRMGGGGNNLRLNLNPIKKKLQNTTKWDLINQPTTDEILGVRWNYKVPVTVECVVCNWKYLLEMKKKKKKNIKYTVTTSI